MKRLSEVLSSYTVILLLASGLITSAMCQERPYKNGKEIEEMMKDHSPDSFAIASWEYSFIGDKKSLVYFDKGEGTPPKHNLPDSVINSLKGACIEDAATHIISKINQHRIIAINEAHHQPAHRVFTESLLEGAYASGYRYLMLEAIAEDSVLNIRKWPKIEDGYYTREPQFGNLIRKALKMGFIVLGYESVERGKFREIGQARNISKVFEKDPDAKILIHCGFSHIAEEGHPKWGKCMAGELKSLTGLDPLTIDQVDYSEHGIQAYENPLYRMIVVGRPGVVVDSRSKKNLLRTSQQYECDINVVHPPARTVYGRPAYLLRNGNWKPYSLSNLNFKVEFPCLVAAYVTSEEPIESVPVDQIELHFPDEKDLILPPGEYTLVITDRSKAIFKQNILIE